MHNKILSFLFLVIVMWFSKGLDKYTFLFVLFVIDKEDISSIRMWEKRSEVKLSVNKSSIGKPFKRLPFYGKKDRCFYYILVIDFQLLIRVSVFAKIGPRSWKMIIIINDTDWVTTSKKIKMTLFVAENMRKTWK